MALADFCDRCIPYPQKLRKLGDRCSFCRRVVVDVTVHDFGNGRVAAIPLIEVEPGERQTPALPLTVMAGRRGR